MNANIVFGITTLALALALTLWFILYIRRQKKARLDREQRLRDIERTHREHQAELFRLQQERFGRPGPTVRDPQACPIGQSPGLGAGYGLSGAAAHLGHGSTGESVYLATLASQIDNGDLSHEDDDRRRHHHTPPSDSVIESSAHDHSSHSHDSGSSDSGGGCDCGGGGSD